ncbi:MAG: hypothetical protein AAF958_11625 [Planctomycetota bacterium]
MTAASTHRRPERDDGPSHIWSPTLGWNWVVGGFVIALTLLTGCTPSAGTAENASKTGETSAENVAGDTAAVDIRPDPSLATAGPVGLDESAVPGDSADSRNPVGRNDPGRAALDLDPVNGDGFGPDDRRDPDRGDAMFSRPNFDTNLAASASGELIGEPVSEPIGAPEPLPLRLRDLRIPDDASPRELNSWIADADHDLAILVKATREDGQDRRSDVAAILKSKLEAINRLRDAPEQSDADKIAATREALQTLSGLYSLGQREFGPALDQAAKQAVDSDDRDLAVDGHVVRMTLASRAIATGDPVWVGRVVANAQAIGKRLIVRDRDGKTRRQSVSDAMATIIALGNARATLNRFDEGEAAESVRRVIQNLYAASSNETVAMAAAQMAGATQQSELEQLRASIMTGKSASPAAWSQAVQRLIDDAPDLQTVRYLGALALELESIDAAGIAKTIYDALAQRFPSADSTAAREARVALDAAARRREVLGQRFAPKLPSADGGGLSIDDYRGFVLMVPFWERDVPSSIAILDDLRGIRERAGDDVMIVGVNLDPELSAVAAAKVLGSTRSFKVQRVEGGGVDGGGVEGGRSIAEEFGLVAYPFVLVVGKDGKIAGIGFGPDQVRTLVASERER